MTDPTRDFARANHRERLLTVFDSGEAAGQLRYTMPYVAGASLRDRLRRGAVISGCCSSSNNEREPTCRG